MNDMSPVIVPKSDQISADDFIAGPRTYQIERVEIRPGTEQPVSVFLVGEDRAWRPCKSMSRCLVSAWGPDAKVYVGRSVTLYRDPKVKWGGMEVGGIRISHLSHINGDMVLNLTATKGKRVGFTVKPLPQPSKPTLAHTTDQPLTLGQRADAYAERIASAPSVVKLNAIKAAAAKLYADLEEADPELKTALEQAWEHRSAELSAGGGEPEA